MSDTMKNKPEDLKTDAENQATELNDNSLDGVVGGAGSSGGSKLDVKIIDIDERREKYESLTGGM